ncbi:hypothetical protein C8R46DRAFT_1216883 [Mycena filopes]|nr:hypothetical protein C8R46DRAFT_1216883 [Mycena filopes]
MFAERNSGYHPLLPRRDGISAKFRRLRLDVLGLFLPADVDFTDPLFRNITHLELFEELPQELYLEDAYSVYAVMTTLPNLTHIAFDQQSLGSVMEPLFETHARLCCFVLFYEMSDELLSGPRRPEVVHNRGIFDFRADWFRGIQTGGDHWTLAEEFIAAKRVERVDASIYTILAPNSLWRS